jgi:hypothetical protein
MITDTGSRVVGISADGSRAVIGSQSAFDDPNYLWTRESGVVYPADTETTYYRGISADGSTIIQFANGIHSAGDFIAGPGQFITAVSGNGSVVVGRDGNSAYRWTQETGVRRLGTLPGASSSVATGVSSDGKVVVGVSGSTGFRWTNDEGLTALPISPTHISTNGSRISGYSVDGQLVLWDKLLGQRTLVSVLQNARAKEVEGWTLFSQHALSSNGRYAAGVGYNPAGDFAAWLAMLPPDPYEWVAGSGLFGEGANWLPGVAPGADDGAVFKRIGKYDVNLLSSVINAQLSVDAGEVSLSGQSYLLSEQATIDHLGSLSVENKFNARKVVVGASDGSSPTLRVKKGSITTQMLDAARDVDANATITVAGPDALMLVEGHVRLGGAGKATMTVSDQASVEIKGDLEILGRSALEVIDSGRLKVLGNVTTIGPNGMLVGSGIEIASATGKSNLVNQGDLSVLNDRYMVSEGSQKAGVFVDGDFAQTKSGTLHIDLTSSTKLSRSAVSSALVVNGTATLAGKLEVGIAEGFVPDVGDRFAVILADEVEGRFGEFVVQDENLPRDRFLGLNYRRVASTQGSLRVDSGLLDLTDGAVEIVTLEAPRGLTGQKPNLVLIVHGTNSQASNLLEVSAAIRSGVNMATTDVAVFDWKDFAGGGLLGGPVDEFTNIPLFDPWQSANNGVNIGESLTNWLTEKKLLASYQSIHLLGHSSGAWLVDAIADTVDPAKNVQLTLWDAFVPPAFLFKQGVDSLTPSDLGDKADFVEQYFDASPQFGGTANRWTQERLPKAVNVDVTRLGDVRLSPLAAHAWPYNWYKETAINNTAAIGGFGFPRSFASGSEFPVHEGFLGKGSELILQENGTALAAYILQSRKIDLLLDTRTVITGDVVIDQKGAVFATNSPSMLTLLFDLDATVHIINFDFDFLTDSPAVLSFYIGTELIWELASADLPPIDGLLNTGSIYVGELAPGPHSMIVRLDNLTDTQSRLRIENLSFGRFVAVPEPSTLILFLVGIIGVSRRLGRGRAA